MSFYTSDLLNTSGLSVLPFPDVSISSPELAPYSTWTTGAKEGIGTAYYDPTNGPSSSNVWFTLAQGALTEVYYPTVAQANLQTAQFMITDRKTFIDLEETDTVHHTKLLMQDALIFQQVNTAKSGKYEIHKTYVVDPDANTLCIHVTFRALVGKVDDYDLLLYVNPIINNDVSDDAAYVRRQADAAYLIAKDASQALAVRCYIPFAAASIGYRSETPNFLEVAKSCYTNAPNEACGPGDVWALGKIPLAAEATDVGGREYRSFTLWLGFGASDEEAIKAVESSSSSPFDDVLERYWQGWRAYVSSIDKPLVGNPQQYYAAVMTLKAHEDKVHPGAIVASLTIPWGDSIAANHPLVGGYHLVWARDLYHVASALAVVGDKSTAKRALAFLDDVQQKPDGSFPQNSWLDGTPYWNGLQLDEVAFPILLALQLEEYHRYPSLVKPAADFIVNHGPYTQQERWEENAGFSPSSMAAQIAALVAAASMARKHEDYSSAAMYLQTADEWVEQVDEWTAAQGEWSTEPYYVRVSDTNDPQDNHWIALSNGGGWHPKSRIVDPGFLELVRLGIKRPDDELIVRSLNIVDEVLKHDAPYGPVWYRYNHDGYGEKNGGYPYDGTGIGRPWPVLTGERGEYEVALATKLKSRRPNHIFGPERLLDTMAGSANQGRMIPEQVWDEAAVAHRNLQPGSGTGCATPLAWAMAQYVRLVKCIAEGRIVEMPRVVWERYIGARLSDTPSQPSQISQPSHLTFPNEPVTPPPLQIQYPAHGDIVHTVTTELKGITGPHYTVVVCSGRMKLAHTTADINGVFTLSLAMSEPGEHTFYVLAYDNADSVWQTEVRVLYEPPVLLEVNNFCGGGSQQLLPERYEYPSSPVFRPGDFDLKQVRISADETNVYFEIELGNLDNPWDGPSGISKQLIDIYVDMDGIPDSGQRWTMGLGARFSPEAAWEKLIRVTGNWCGEAHVYNSDWSNAGSVRIRPDYRNRKVLVSAPIHALGGVPTTDWGFMVLVAGERDGGVRQVRAHVGEWHFGGGTDDETCPQFIDAMLPSEDFRRKIFSEPRHDYVELPVVRIPQPFEIDNLM